MTVRETSIEAYHKIVNNGLLSKRRMEVYDFIFHNQPVSLNTIIAALSRPGFNTGSYSGRISELERLGVIEPQGQIVAPQTKHIVLLWVTTDNLPGVLPKFESKADIIKRQAKEIERLQRDLVVSQEESKRLRNERGLLL